MMTLIKSLLTRSACLSITALVAITPGLLSCSSAKTIENSYIQENVDDQFITRVYFIRPKPYKYKGLADSRIRVDINSEPLLHIDEGAYTLVKIKPTQAKITTHSRTQFTNQTQPINVSRSRDYRFIAGKTYFIHLDRINEEFRGIFYDPAPVSLNKAKELSKNLRAVGIAKDEPIKDIKQVAATPDAGSLVPALPETLYPGKPYLIKGTPKYEAPEQPEGKNEITFDKPSESESGAK